MERSPINATVNERSKEMATKHFLMSIFLIAIPCGFGGAVSAQSTATQNSHPISVAILPFQGRSPINATTNNRSTETRTRTEQLSRTGAQEAADERRGFFVDRETRLRDLANETITTTETTSRTDNSDREKEIAAVVVDLLTIKLLSSQYVMLVERSEIEQIFDELKLSRSGLVNAAEANQLGRFSGARLLVTGSVVRIDNDLYLIAKVMGAETSRLAGASVKGPANADLGKLVDKLAAELEVVFKNKGLSLLPRIETESDWVSRIRQGFARQTLPTVTVQLQSKQGNVDTAAARELERLLKELGFEVIAGDHPNAGRAELAVVGEARSEFAYRRGDWVATRCRIDLQIRSQNDGTVLASDSEACTVFDIGDTLGGRQGLEDAMRRLAERVATRLTR
jgi:hypothetical protein